MLEHGVCELAHIIKKIIIHVASFASGFCYCSQLSDEVSGPLVYFCQKGGMVCVGCGYHIYANTFKHRGGGIRVEFVFAAFVI